MTPGKARELLQQAHAYQGKGRIPEALDIGRIREKEALHKFDAEFIELARSVYKRNDERASIKRQINALLASDLVEEKSYRTY